MILVFSRDNSFVRIMMLSQTTTTAVSLSPILLSTQDLLRYIEILCLVGVFAQEEFHFVW